MSQPSPFSAHWSALLPEAAFADYKNWIVPLHFGNSTTEHLALRKRAGIVDTSFLGMLRLSGPDCQSFLNRLSTVDMDSLQTGQFRFGFFLSAQGKVISMFRLLHCGDSYLCIPQLGLEKVTLAHLEKFLISEDLSIQDETGTWAGLGIHGPDAKKVLDPTKTRCSLAFEADAFKTFSIDGAQGLVIPSQRTGETGFEFFLPTNAADSLWDFLYPEAIHARVKPVGLEAENSLRFEAGTWNYGMEIDDSIIPLEADLGAWVPQNQGCYLGQEVIERIRSLGTLPKKLQGFHVSGEQAISAGMVLEHNGQTAGIVVNAMHCPSLEKQMAVAYVKRHALDESSGFSVAATALEKVALPFYKHSD